MPYASIDLNATGNVVAAVTGKRIRVVTYVLVASGAGTVTWRSATTALSGAMTVATGTPISAAPLPEGLAGQKGHLETATGEALNLLISGSIQVSGHLVYEVVP